MKNLKVPFYSLSEIHKRQREALEQAFISVLDKNWFVLGENLQTFEREFASYLGCNYSVGVGNGLEALQLSLMALDISKGDEVLVPAHTFSASFLAIVHTGAKPVPIEVNNMYNIEVELINKSINSRTKAIMPVHLYGNPCNMDEIGSIAKEHNLWIIEDYAQAVGASFKNKKVGTFGHINACSFYPSKNLGALGDAGAITTDNEEIYQKLLKLRNYGSAQKYEHEFLGLNSRMDELQAAFLSTKLPILDEWNKERNKLALRYSEALKGINDLILPSVTENGNSVWHIYAIRTIHRNKLQQYLASKGIQTVIHYPTPPHLQKSFSFLGHRKGDFPVTEQIADETLSLPLYPGLRPTQQQYVIDCILKFLAEN